MHGQSLVLECELSVLRELRAKQHASNTQPGSNNSNLTEISLASDAAITGPKCSAISPPKPISKATKKHRALPVLAPPLDGYRQ